MTLATVSWALKPPTEKFPLGYGKIESLGSLGVSSLLVAGGVLMGWSAIVDLCHLYLPAVAEAMEQLHLVGHSHSHSHQIPNMGAAWLAGGSVLVKEWLYRASESLNVWIVLHLLNRLHSSQDSKGAEIIDSAIERRSPPRGLPHGHCGARLDSDIKCLPYVLRR